MTSRPYDHIDVVISGVIMNGVQQWSCQFTNAAIDHSELPGDTSVGDLITIATGVRTALQGPGPLLSLMGSDTSVKAVRAYLRKAGDPVAAFVGEDTTLMGGAGTPTVPPQCAVVATLLTGAAGRRNRGRVYWPIAGSSSRLLTSGQNATIANETRDIIDSLRTTCSAVWGTAAGPVVGNNGLLVTRVRVDNVIDTQRRRRDKINPTSTAVADPTVP